MSRRIVGGVVTLLLAGGCASTSPLPDEAAVARLVADRGGRAPPWDRQSPFDAAVDARVRALLAKPLTADAAVEVALLRSPGLRATYEELGIAQADLVQAGLLPNPSIGGSVGFPLGGSPNLAVQGTVVEELLGILLIPLRKRFARAELVRAEELVGHAVLDADAEVRQAFVRYQAARQLEKLRRTILEAESASAQLARRQLAAGNISELDEASRRAVYELFSRSAPPFDGRWSGAGPGFVRFAELRIEVRPHPQRDPEVVGECAARRELLSGRRDHAGDDGRDMVLHRADEVAGRGMRPGAVAVRTQAGVRLGVGGVE